MAVSLVIEPLSVVLALVGPREDSFSLSLVVLEIAPVRFVVGIGQQTLAVHLVLHPHAIVSAIVGPRHLALPVPVTIMIDDPVIIAVRVL